VIGWRRIIYVVDIDYRMLFSCASYMYRDEVGGVDCFCLDILRDLFVDIYGYSRVFSFLINKMESAVSRIIRLLIERVSLRFLNYDYVVRF
jgi:hypothetical protein